MIVRNLRNLIQPLTYTRAFSSVVSKRLAKSLEKELRYEEEEYKIDESVGPFLQESGFDLEDKEGVSRMKLFKEVEGHEVEVTFSARSPMGEEEEEKEEGEEEEEMPNNYCEFQVTIKKKGTNKGLIYECNSFYSEIQFSNIVYSEELDSVSKNSDFFAKNEYRGPDFSTLDEKLQNALMDYLKEMGINDDVAIFVESYSLDKEQRLYMEWLKKMKDFISI